ncbi:ATP-binding cassette domain-containing protein [Pseudomonas sp. GLN_3]|uniref:ATP-binding cassette domain-containing protein n=1 Tax=Pseudomonas sp. GLN_3 TaxID=3367181 RepID=UPI00370B8622
MPLQASCQATFAGRARPGRTLSSEQPRYHQPDQPRHRPGHDPGLVGESGSGKSTLCRALMGLVKPSSGYIGFDGEDLSRGRSNRTQEAYRGLRMVFQDPYASLNPRQHIADMLDTTLKVDGVRDRAERQRRVSAIIDAVGLPARSAQRFAHEFSGGQRQRIAIARALVTRPQLVVCDEPVSALDVSVRAQILNLLNVLKHEMNLAYLFISHDLAVVRYMADEVAVMHKGRIVEQACASEIWHAPRVPYTRQLIEASR